MKEENKKLGDLYKDTFKDFEEPGTGYDWNEVEKRLDKVKFYRLSFTHFNIYYSLLIITCFIASVTSAAHYFFVTVPKLNEQYSVIITDTVSVNSTIKIKKTYNNSEAAIKGRELDNNRLLFKKEKSDSPNEQPRSQKPGDNKAAPPKNGIINADPKTNYPQNFLINDGEAEQSAGAEESTIKNDSITNVKAPIPLAKDSLKNKKEPKTIKKTVYITKQDTIFEYDTLKTKKNRKFKK